MKTGGADSCVNLRKPVRRGLQKIFEKLDDYLRCGSENFLAMNALYVLQTLCSHFSVGGVALSKELKRRFEGLQRYGQI